MMAQAPTLESPPNGASGQTYRRNGKPFSCEPCRLGKLKCGHELPTCSRCLRRGKQRDCVYHPAPMTKARESPSSVQKPKRNSQVSLNRASTASQIQTIDFSQPPPVLPDNRPASTAAPFTAFSTFDNNRFRSVGSAPTTTSTPPSSHSPFTPTTQLFKQSASAVPSAGLMKDKIGYLGSSAFSAVFTENQRSLGIQEEEPERSSSPTPVSAERIHRGAEVLSLFRDMNLFTQFLKRVFQMTDGITVIRPTYENWIDGIEQSFGELLRNHRTIQELYPLSELVWRNTEKTMTFTGSTTSTQWARMHTGQNLRWETIAGLCCVVTLLSLNLSDWDPVFVEAKAVAANRVELTEKMTSGMELSLQFCRDCESITDLYLCILFESVLAIEAVQGDTHYLAWVRIGEVINTCIHLGLHQEKRQDENTPFIVNETRIRLFDHVYGHDKSLSTFLGRPPRLSYRYCVIQLPLDLSDDEMYLEGEELQRAIDNLNGGWNTQGRLHRITWRRIWSAHAAQLREDILEIMLGTDSTNLAERGERIRAKIKVVDENMPELIKTDIVELLAQCQSPNHPFMATWDRDRMPWIVLHLLSIKAGMIHTSLLLEKALMNRLKTGTPPALIDHARVLLKYVLAGAAKRDFMRDHQIDIVYMIAFHGIPAAGILAVEMLKQEQTRQFTPVILPRSEIIQDLSVFISTLGAVEPAFGGNYVICKKAMKVMRKVLDKILSPQMPIQPSPEATFEDPSLYFPAGSDAEFMTWLENIEWERGSLFNT